ncbi:hypothetical protein ABB37_07895 [Leptomonas pyrrhocoris]|uniref:RING-type domain-containing protein n=1 Tax=Leptomonas pyrrhocoris TaxID=157538 RepID=A0A0M9FUH5_LEPPY|nr:hypothetical protein ABB37_07895 [Leptomonas pyrrhocoris]KPA76126.1 hypothetical protein ABB37_07895 [Leptomonas pyrrhocoris]|eukprot:XP_015654565.1 hypothetical protein ABB37_07895 [Leptomonas pyrrhocoris]
MNLGEVFQNRVNEVEETGMELYLVFFAMGKMLTVIPDDDEVAREQRAQRNERRKGGEEILFSQIRSGDGGDGGDEAEAADANKGSSKNGNANSSGSTNHNSGDNSGDSFVSPTSFRSDQSFSSHSEGVGGMSQAAYMKARVEAESTLQLRVFDFDPRQWTLQFLATAAKFICEEFDRYLQQVHLLLRFMAVRRRRIEKRSAVLRERQARAAKTPADAVQSSNQPTTTTTTTTAPSTSLLTSLGATLADMCKAVAGPRARDAADDIAPAESDTDLSAEEEQRVAVSLPDSLLRQKADTLSSFFSIYVAVVMREETPMRVIKSVGERMHAISVVLHNYPREPLDIVEQLHRDREDQAASFLAQWMTKGEGRLAPLLMASPPASASDAAQRSSSSSRSSAVGSTIGPESVMDSEGNYSPQNTAGALEEASRPVAAAEDAARTHSGDCGTSGGADAADAEGVRVGWESLSADAIAPACPPVDAATARELIAEFRASRSPCTSRLAQLVVDTVPGMDETALLPCIAQPERHGFNDGCIRLTPFMTTAEEALLTQWMQVRLTELMEDAEESVLVRAWASPTYDARGGELTVLLNPTNAFRMQLSNPADFLVSGLKCDMCCQGSRSVSYQAVLESGVRSEVVLGYEGCVGYDMCVACSYNYYRCCEIRLLRAVHPDAAVRQPFAYGLYSKTVVQSLRVEGSHDDDAAVVKVVAVMGVSPFGVLPIGWLLPRSQLTALSAACALTEDYVELTAAEHAALPVPGAHWQEHCRITNVSKRVLEGVGEGDEAAAAAAAASVVAAGGKDGDNASADVAEADVCPICLQLLHSPLPVLRTLCGHWFHVECIGSHYHYKPAVVDGEVNEANGCPVCRCAHYMPSLTDVATTLHTNVYRLEMRVPVSEAPFAIAVGTILTDDGVYHNATNVAACTAFFDLVPGYEYTAEAAASPVTPS